MRGEEIGYGYIVAANSFCAVDVNIRHMKVRLKSKSNSSRPFIPTCPHLVLN